LLFDNKSKLNLIAFIGTARTVYAQQGLCIGRATVRLSVCLSVPAWAQAAAAAAMGPAGRVTAARRVAANAGSATLPAGVEG